MVPWPDDLQAYRVRPQSYVCWLVKKNNYEYRRSMIQTISTEDFLNMGMLPLE